MERRGAEDGVRVAFDQLQEAIDRRVRSEQLRDQLTGLPNELALIAALDDLLEHKEQFWIAFFEIDRFKWINDEFGYQSADALLGKVAEILDNSEHFFEGTVSAFRPHGDEFYLLGKCDGERDVASLGKKLDLIRQNIAHLRVRADLGVATCTVSVGWLEIVSFEAHLAEQQTVLTRREVLSALERTVAEAKWTRDTVIRFSPALDSDETLTLRSDCTGCRCKFQVNVKRSTLENKQHWWCPNCGAELERPPAPSRVVAPQRAEV